MGRTPCCTQWGRVALPSGQLDPVAERRHKTQAPCSAPTQWAPPLSLWPPKLKAWLAALGAHSPGMERISLDLLDLSGMHEWGAGTGGWGLVKTLPCSSAGSAHSDRD